MRKLHALAGATSLGTFYDECEGMGPMLAGFCEEGSTPPPWGRGVTSERACEAAVAAASEAPELVPALAAALATGLRLLFPRGPAAGWEPRGLSAAVSMMVGLLAEFLPNTPCALERVCPAWSNSTLTLLRRTGGLGRVHGQLRCQAHVQAGVRAAGRMHSRKPGGGGSGTRAACASFLSASPTAHSRPRPHHPARQRLHSALARARRFWPHG